MAYFKKVECNLQMVFVLLTFIHLSVGATVTDISRLRADLLRNHDPHSRPVQNHENVTVITIDFELKGFDLNERTSILSVNTWTYMWWEDEHLKWDPLNYGNLTSVHFAFHELWKPDVTVYNNVDKSEIDHFGNTQIFVLNTSFVWWVPPAKFQVSCETNLRNWPYDTQTCTIVLGSWAHDGSALDIEIPEGDTEMHTGEYESNREWDLVGTTVEKRVRFYSAVPGVPFPDIKLTITIARKSAAHTACIIVAGLVAAAVLVAFWLPPGSTQRLSILLVSILINVLYLKFLYSIIPNNGESVPLVLIFYRDSLVMLAFALIWTISLRYLAATKRDSPVPLPGIIDSFLNSIPAKILCLDPRPFTGTGRGGTSGGDGGDATEQGEGTGNWDTFGMEKNSNPFQADWAWLAHLLDRVLFVIYLIIYLCFYVALL